MCIFGGVVLAVVIRMWRAEVTRKFRGCSHGPCDCCDHHHSCGALVLGDVQSFLETALPAAHHRPALPLEVGGSQRCCRRTAKAFWRSGSLDVARKMPLDWEYPLPCLNIVWHYKWLQRDAQTIRKCMFCLSNAFATVLAKLENTMNITCRFRITNKNKEEVKLENTLSLNTDSKRFSATRFPLSLAEFFEASECLACNNTGCGLCVSQARASSCCCPLATTRKWFEKNPLRTVHVL